MVWSTNTQHRDRDPVSPLDFLDFRRARSFSDLQATFSFLTTATLPLPPSRASFRRTA
jgi:hypothetical protein